MAQPGNLKVKELIDLSSKFPRPFPVKANRCQTLLLKDPNSENILERNINETYPVLHERALSLFCKFLEHKKKCGTKIEKELYENMGLVDFVDRLFAKRAVAFYCANDTYVLLNGRTGVGGWESVGKAGEEPPLLLKDCLSYDEMKLSALLVVSSPSVFINDGHRHNRGIPSTSSSLETNGIIVGVVGARLEKDNVMEWQEVIVSKTQNILDNGYGPVQVKKPSTVQHAFKRIWSKFYGVTHLPLYQEVCLMKNGKYKELSKDGLYFNNDIYKKRVEVTALTLLLEANHRAAKESKKAYVHVVGYGLGVWSLSAHQEKVFMDAFHCCFHSLTLDHISDVDFSWFTETSCGGVTDGGFVKGTNIRLHFSRRNPHERLTGEDAGKLIVVTYAWDGNALPGNEYWTGGLSSSGDPAAACSSQIAELHNPHINKKVSGANLHIACSAWGVIHISEYAKRMLKKLKKTPSKVNLRNSEHQ